MKTTTNISLLITILLLCSCATRNPEVERIGNAISKASEDFISLVCTNPEYSAFYANTPCLVEDIDLIYISNNNKVADEDKAIVLDYFRVANSLNDYNISLVRQFYRAPGIVNGAVYLSVDVLIDALETNKEENSSNILSLYTQEITWGEFNENRLEINNRLRNQAVAASTPPPSAPQPSNPVSSNQSTNVNRNQAPVYDVNPIFDSILNNWPDNTRNGIDLGSVEKQCRPLGRRGNSVIVSGICPSGYTEVFQGDSAIDPMSKRCRPLGSLGNDVVVTGICPSGYTEVF